MSLDVGQRRRIRRRAGVGRASTAWRPVGVQHRDPGLDQPRQRRGDGGVQRPGALRAAEHQQHRAVGGQAEALAGGGPQGGTVQRGHRPPQRDPEHLRSRQPAAGHRGGDERGEPGADLVRQAGPGVRLVHDDRHAAARGEVGGQRDVAAEPDDDVRVDPRSTSRVAPTRAENTRPGSRSRSPLGLRGSGTGGISSSG